MQPRILAALTAAVIVGLGACRSAPRVADDAFDGGCRAEVEGANLSGWREVRGDGFTFCVPGDWRVSGRFAQRGTMRIEWNAGVPTPADLDAPLPGTGEVRPRGLMGTSPANPTESFRFTETIDGRRAELYREALASTNAQALEPLYLTGAQWLGPTIHFRGRAAKLSDSETQLLVYRSVRFSTH